MTDTACISSHTLWFLQECLVCASLPPLCSMLVDNRHSLHLRLHTLGGASIVRTACQPAYLDTSSIPSQDTFAQYLRMSRCCSSTKVQYYLHNQIYTLQQMVHVAKVLSRQAGLFWASRYVLCKGVEQIRRYTRRNYTVNAAYRTARQCRVGIMHNTSSPVV